MNNIQVTDLDFDDIKANLKSFLQAQSEFTDYDFEGSGLAVLLDVLAYNTHYNAYMANMLANEMFLDSAIKRSSAVSIAKQLGYTPRSDQAAAAMIDITVNNPIGLPNFLTLDRYTSFNSSTAGKSHSFINVEPLTIQPANGVYTFKNVRVVEGTPYSFSYTSTAPGPAERFEIPNLDVDTTTIVVTVQTSATNTATEIYTQAHDITGVDGNSQVYYLEENTIGYYTILFGDGVLGKKLTAGNIITIRYLITTGAAANVGATAIQSFSMAGTIEGNSAVTISTVHNAIGGGTRETIDEIRFNAPRAFIAQNRAITSDDYASVIKSNVSNVESVITWGGEDNVPPIYGKLFISLKPNYGYTITRATKQHVINEVLKTRKVVGIVPEFVDPEYIFMNLHATVKYDPSKTTLPSANIQAAVHNVITKYFDIELEKFNTHFILSKLLRLIDASSPSIVGTLLDIKVQRRVSPLLNTSMTETMYFNNRLHPATVESTRFYYIHNGLPISVRLRDIPGAVPADYDGTGTLQLYNSVTNELILSNAGTIDYKSGKVQLTGFKIYGYPGDQTDVRITVGLQESAYNFNVSRNQILTIDDGTLSRQINRNQGLTIDIIAEVQ